MCGTVTDHIQLSRVSPPGLYITEIDCVVSSIADEQVVAMSVGRRRERWGGVTGGE